MSAGKGFPETSIIASCSIVTPPPEYLHFVPGTKSTRISEVFATGFSPFRICTIVGIFSSTSYPGNPCTVSPAVWLASRRKVTFCSFVNSFSGTFHVLSFPFHVFVEREFSGLHQRQHSRCRHGLADRPRLKQRFRRHRRV